MKPTVRSSRTAHGWKVECLVADEPVSSLWINDRTMRIGSATVKMGGIGGVSTRSEHRHRGYSRLCMDAATELMNREGYGMGLLFGIPDFYDKFGYITCMAEHTLAMGTRDAERAKSLRKSRRAKPADFPAIARIYNRDNKALTGSCVRNPAQWSRFEMGSWFNRKVGTRVVTDARDRVVAYMAYDDESDKCCAAEIGGRSADAFAALLEFLARRAVKLRREEITFKMPADHPFARWARQFGLNDRTTYPRNSNGMARITNLVSCFQNLSGELSNRAVPVPGPTAVRIATDIGTVCLFWRNGRISLGDPDPGTPTVRIDQNHLTQLLMGYATPADLLAAGSMKAPVGILPFVECLFPLSAAHMWWSDRF